MLHEAGHCTIGSSTALAVLGRVGNYLRGCAGGWEKNDEMTLLLIISIQPNVSCWYLYWKRMMRSQLGYMLVGGWSNPFEKYPQVGSFFPIFGLKKLNRHPHCPKANRGFAPCKEASKAPKGSRIVSQLPWISCYVSLGKCIYKFHGEAVSLKLVKGFEAEKIF